ncbi:hypothetical protein [Arthrobacter sp. AFG20]|uniref:hypothetical protein n=1 Tax=Arthrobacter sp. AFG20 TaxID=1688671 RepID=UPI002154FB75|nr:hypothetical protein [Arthrobacter sp. AFG20]
MGFDPYEPAQRRQLRAALKASDITPAELWLNYFSIGGTVGEYEVEAYLQGLLSLPEAQRDLLAMAANELIDAVPRLRAPYADELDTTAGPGEDGEHPDVPGYEPTRGASDQRPGEQEQGQVAPGESKKSDDGGE